MPTQHSLPTGSLFFIFSNNNSNNNKQILETNMSQLSSAMLIELKKAFFSNGVVNLWISLPVCSLRKFSGSLNNDYLLKYCKGNFT